MNSFSHWFCPIGLLSPTMPFPPQGPQGPMAFGQPRPPLMGYGGMLSNFTVFSLVEMCLSVRPLLLSWFWVVLFSRWTSLPSQPIWRRQRQLRQLSRTRWLPGKATQPQVRPLYVWFLFCNERLPFLPLAYFEPLFLWSFLFFLLGLCLSPCTLNHLRMSRGDPRNIIEYRDLDAPDDMDFF